MSLVLGVVRAGASAFGAAGDDAMAALDLLGLGPSPDLPPLDIADLTEHGVSALNAWFADVMSDPTKRHAWLAAVQDLLGGAFEADDLKVPLGSGPASVLLGMTAVPGPGGHLRVTPRASLQLSTLIGAGPNAVRLGATAAVDLITVDMADGSLVAVPSAELPRRRCRQRCAAAEHRTGSRRVGATRCRVPERVTAAVGKDARRTDRHERAPGRRSVERRCRRSCRRRDRRRPRRGGVERARPRGRAPERAARHRATGRRAPARRGPAVRRPVAGAPRVVERPRHPALGEGARGTGPPPRPDLDRFDRRPRRIGGSPHRGFWHEGRPVVGDARRPGVTRRVARVVGARRRGDARLPIRRHRRQVHASSRHAPGANWSPSISPVVMPACSVPPSWSRACRARGQPEARLSLGPVAIVADSLGLAARWTATGGFAVGLDVPNLAADVGTARVPLALPVGPDWESAVFVDVENLVAVLGASNPAGWLNDLVFLLGWTLGGEPQPRRLSLAALAVDAQAELARWATQLLTDEDILGSIGTALARLLTGSTTGLAGVISGRGTPTDPWVLPLSSGARTRSRCRWRSDLTGRGCHPRSRPLRSRRGDPGCRASPQQGSRRRCSTRVRSPTTSGRWRAGEPVWGRARQPRREGDEHRRAGRTAHDTAGRGRDARPPRVLVRRVAGRLGRDGPRGGAGARERRSFAFAIGSATSNPWPTAPADRFVDLTAPGLSPESFTVAAPATGEWFVSLATRADATLGTADPSGVLGQAARLSRVIGSLGAVGPVVVVAIGGAGHAARLAADAQTAVSHLVTLGTPWSAVSFDSARNGSSADALRLLAALLPAVDPSDPDDADLALGRAIVEGLSNRRLQSDLEAPLPEVSVRGGLSVTAWFGGLDLAAVERAMTAIVAGGLSLRAQARAVVSLAPATDARLALADPDSRGAAPERTRHRGRRPHRARPRRQWVRLRRRRGCTDRRRPPHGRRHRHLVDRRSWHVPRGRSEPRSRSASSRRGSKSASAEHRATPSSCCTRSRRSAPTETASSCGRPRR